MGCGCRQPVIRNPKPTPEEIKIETNGESETTSTDSTGTDDE
jgi:hypothetical protein